jgi:hypothetical protein
VGLYTIEVLGFEAPALASLVGRVNAYISTFGGDEHLELCNPINVIMYQ